MDEAAERPVHLLDPDHRRGGLHRKCRHVRRDLYVNQYPSVSAADRASFDPTWFSLTGIFLAQLAIGVLGVLLIASEHGTGTIRSTFAAVPQRRTVLAAKAAVFSGVTLVVGLASSFIAFFVGQAILSSRHIQAHLGDPAPCERSSVAASFWP
jgi:ABC-2 type transport system permease protein